MRNQKWLAIIILSGGCSGSTPAQDSRLEGPIPDRALAERSGDRSGSTEAHADLRRDQPKVPAHWAPANWATIPGASLGYLPTITPLLDGGALIVGGWTIDPASGNHIHHAMTYRYLASTNTIVKAGELKHPRDLHTATRLADGRVLVVGGADASDYLVSSEIFDPTKPTLSGWSAGPDLPEIRPGHSATLLPSGEVMVLGGGLDKALSTILLFQPSTMSWKLSLATLKKPRRYHTASLLQNGKLLIAGGVQGDTGLTYLSDLEVLDPKSGASTALSATMSKARAFHSATLLDDGRVLVVGGSCGSCAGSSFDDLYDPKSDSLAQVPHPGGGLTAHFAAKLPEGRVLIGGNDYGSNQRMVAFNAGGSSPGWDVLPNPVQAHYRGEAATLLDGTVLVVGGVTAEYPSVYADQVERFFP